MTALLRNTNSAPAKAQAFAHRLVEFADYEMCVRFFSERNINFDRANDMGWNVLMSVCACGRDDLVGFVIDRTVAVDCATYTNKTTVLHLSAMSTNPCVVEELIATANRKQKLQKIINQSNAHGDTALMMACVAKNVVAVQLFIEMGARLDLLNASGLNALMCAARAGKDPRPAAPAVPETMERSAAIVEILLANGADVNALEKNEGNAALHLAVLSKNFNAVESLIKISLDLDITIRNKAGKTAMDLGRQIFGESSKQMNDLLSEKWAQNFEESICLSAKVEQQLLALTAQEENIIALDEKPSLKYEKKKNKKTKKKNMGLVKAPERLPIECGHKDKMKADSFIDSSEDDTLSLKQSKAKADQESASLYSELRTIEHEFDDDGGWQSVSTKKNRRKELSGDNAEKASNRNPAISTNIGLKDCSSNIELGSLQKPHRSQLKISKAISSVNALWDEQPNSKLTQSTVTESPRRLVITGDDKNWVITSNLSYDVLNRSFYRTFPVAADLEINVEQFLIASSVSDRELEPNNSLSISQVEALQEAHWQAYHYLNEKKIELTSGLEAQRIEALFALQQELMEIK